MTVMRMSVGCYSYFEAPMPNFIQDLSFEKILLILTNCTSTVKGLDSKIYLMRQVSKS